MSSTTKILHYSGPNVGKSYTALAPKSLWGEAISFLEQKSASKAQKSAILRTFQANGGLELPFLATVLGAHRIVETSDLKFSNPTAVKSVGHFSQYVANFIVNN